MPHLISTCSKCGAEFSWNSDFGKAPLCPKCGYDTIYGGKRNKRGKIAIIDSGKAAEGMWPLRLLFKPKWKNADPQVRIQQVPTLEVEGVLVDLAASDPEEKVRRAARERLNHLQAEEAKRINEPLVEGDLCAARNVAAFLGRNCRRAKDSMKALRAGCTAWLCAPSLAALRKIYPEGRCAKCKSYHSYLWSVAYTFFLPGKRGQRSKREEIEASAKRFADEIARADTRELHFVPGLDWRLDVSDSSGLFSHTGDANTQWIGWGFEAVERAYQQMGGEVPS